MLYLHSAFCAGCTGLRNISEARFFSSAAVFAVLALDKGIAVHALLDARIALVRTDIDHIEGTELFAAQIVSALFHGAMDVRVFLLIHHN